MKIELIVFALVVAGFVFGYNLSEDISPEEPQAARTTVSCSSDSMGILFNCDEEVMVERVRVEDELEPGRIYIYRRENETIIHRLVYCLDGCAEVAIFKGDNNIVGELVERKDVEWLVTGVLYD